MGPSTDQTEGAMSDGDDPQKDGADDNSGDARVPAARPQRPPPIPGERQVGTRGIWPFSDDDEDAEKAQTAGAPATDTTKSDEPGWLDRLTRTLTDLATDISSVTVRTYTAEDVGAAVKNPREIDQVGQLRAWTRIAIDGDTDVCVPTSQGKVDRTLWQLHQQVVDQAQTHRNAMIETLVSSATGLWTGKK